LFFFSSCENQATTSENRSLLDEPGNSCYDQVVTIGCLEDTLLLTLDSIPMFPNCEISVSIIYCLDEQMGLVQIATGDYQLIQTCQELQDSLNYVAQNGTDGELNSFISEIDVQVYNEILRKLFEIHGNNASCQDNQNITYMTEYIRPSCFAYCLFYSEVPSGEGRGGRSDGGGSPQIFWSKSLCDSDGCCLHEYIVCFDNTGDSIKVTKVRVTEVVKPSVLEECSSGTPDGLGDPATVRCLPCEFNCN